MSNKSHFRNLLEELDQRYELSEEFRTMVSNLLDRIEGLDLPSEQLQRIAEKVRETYARQSLLESYRKESEKSIEKIRNSVSTFSSALDSVNQKLTQAETALEKLLGSKTAPPPVPKASDQKVKAMVAFLSLDGKNSRIN